MKHLTASTSPSPFSGENWFDPLEDAIRFRVRAFIEAMVAEEAQAALGGRERYQRSGPAQGLSQRPPAAAACRHLRSAEGVASPRPPARRGWP